MISTRVEIPASNERVAMRLEQIADLLEAQDANPFRIRAYREAAAIVQKLPQPVHEILEREGLEGLTNRPGIGASLARTIEELTYTDHVGILEHLQGAASGEDVLASVPGIGPELAHRIHDELGIENLVELEAAAYDGRLARVAGIGRGRLRGVRESLAGRFRRRPRVPESRRRAVREQPPVSELLDVDAEYRRKARGKELVRIAPRRFNPTFEAWLPILHTERGKRHYTALFSNTARAHELGMTHDWVVIYRDDHGGDGQWTVVTARFGHLRGKRIVRGREEVCRAHYREG